MKHAGRAKKETLSLKEVRILYQDKRWNTADFLDHALQKLKKASDSIHFNGKNFMPVFGEYVSEIADDLRNKNSEVNTEEMRHIIEIVGLTRDSVRANQDILGDKELEDKLTLLVDKFKVLGRSAVERR